MAARPDPIDVGISFDTTGSMYPCLTQVRREVKKLVNHLFDSVPGLRVAVIAHGDYCDAGHPYVTKTMDFTEDRAALCDFIEHVEPTGGGDAPECYELVLNEARALNWKSGRSKVFVLIGDDVPHGPKEAQNAKHLDWRNELDLLSEATIKVYGVQALGRTHATKFYEEIAKRTGGFHLNLNQFADVSALIMAIALKQTGDAAVEKFQVEMAEAGRMNRSMESALNTLLGKKTTPTTSMFGKVDLNAVPPGRFQVLKVEAMDGKKIPIKAFVEQQGLAFKAGRGFYELTKSELVQGTKEIILQNRKTGDFFSGPKAREMIGLPLTDTDVRIKPVALEEFRVFIQSTSYNRALVHDTGFLYEVPDWDRAAA